MHLVVAGTEACLCCSHSRHALFLFSRSVYKSSERPVTANTLKGRLSSGASYSANTSKFKKPYVVLNLGVFLGKRLARRQPRVARKDSAWLTPPPPLPQSLFSREVHMLSLSWFLLHQEAKQISLSLCLWLYLRLYWRYWTTGSNTR